MSKIEKITLLILSIANSSIYAHDTNEFGISDHGLFLTTIAAAFVVMGLVDLKHGAFKVGSILIGTAIIIRLSF